MKDDDRALMFGRTGKSLTEEEIKQMQDSVLCSFQGKGEVRLLLVTCPAFMRRLLMGSNLKVPLRYEVLKQIGENVEPTVIFGSDSVKDVHQAFSVEVTNLVRLYS